MDALSYFFDGSDPRHTAPSLAGVLLGLTMYLGPLAAILGLLLAGLGETPLIASELALLEPPPPEPTPPPSRQHPAS